MFATSRRFAEAADHVVRQRAFGEVRVVHRARRGRRARCGDGDAVDAHAVAAGGFRERARESGGAGFCRAVHLEPRFADAARRRK